MAIRMNYEKAFLGSQRVYFYAFNLSLTTFLALNGLPIIVMC